MQRHARWSTGWLLRSSACRRRRYSTIYALASGALPAALAIIRVSGPDALRAVSALVVPANAPPLEPRRAALRTLREPTPPRRVLDRALLLYFPAPNSATGEDVVEVHAHGAPPVVAGLLRALDSPAHGVRAARPGEFTRRALANGKLSLADVEHLAALTAAESLAESAAALERLRAAPVALDAWRRALLAPLAQLNALIDFDDDVAADSEAAERAVLSDVRGALRALARAIAHATAADAARAVASDADRRALPCIVLSGAPNVGKSSLVNYLAGAQRSIVSARAGTTRDVVRSRGALRGVRCELADTAGVRAAPADDVEAEGVRRAQQAAASADVLVCVAAGADDAAAERAVADAVAAAAGAANALVVCNKADLLSADARRRIERAGALCVSALTHERLDALVDALLRRVAPSALAPRADARHDVLFAQRRQASLIARVSDSLGVAEQLCASVATIDAAADELLGALRLLDEVRDGPTEVHDIEPVLDELFSRFCVGK